MIKNITDICVGDKVYPIYGAEIPYISSPHPHYITKIEGDMITWSYGGNCLPYTVYFYGIRIFKELEEARKFCIRSRIKWVQN